MLTPRPISRNTRTESPRPRHHFTYQTPQKCSAVNSEKDIIPNLKCNLSSPDPRLWGTVLWQDEIYPSMMFQIQILDCVFFFKIIFFLAGTIGCQYRGNSIVTSGAQ